MLAGGGCRVTTAGYVAQMTSPGLRAIALNCTLKRGDGPSSTEVLVREVLEELRTRGVDAPPPVRVANLDVKPGVSSDEGDGDEWPGLRAQILGADIVVFGCPIWLGQPSSVAKRVLERMDAFLGETDDQGRMISSGRVAVVAVVGNEDGAHHVTAELYQALGDVGFTIPASGSTYWVGEAMGSVDYIDLDPKPAKVRSQNALVARHAAHLAGLLKGSGYPPE
jgi:multimeric flavodoxin WrbA